MYISIYLFKVILHTMMRLHSDSKLQLGGTELIQTLIQNEDAKKVLDKIPGGLDWLCQVCLCFICIYKSNYETLCHK
jgi:hypothetical protein